MRGLFSLVVVPAFCAGCVVDVVDEAANEGANEGVVGSAEAPLIGVSGAGDFADRSCQIVLRDFGRVVANSGASFAQNGSRWVFEGRVDVKKTALAEGYSPMILWKAGSDAGWRAIAPIASTGINDDSDRFLFHVDDGDLPGPGISATGLARSTLQVVPFLTRDQSRPFDHNRVVDAFATYVMNQASNFAVAEDNAVCAEASGPTITFKGDFTETQSGPVVAGRSVVVDYDIGRNSPCRQPENSNGNGPQTWSVIAQATWLPMNVRQSVSVVNHGSDPSSSMPATLFAPEGATELVLYFQNNDRGGCSSYDSDFSANYHFAVVDQGPEWMGNVSALLARGADRRCAGAVAFGSKVSFGSWARQRAAMTDLCFEVYEPGVTDFDNADLWQQLDVQAHHRLDPSKPFETDYVSFVDRTGNNARYAFDLRPFDPFTWGKCWTAVPLTSTTEPDGSSHVQATLEVYFTVNGEELRPDGGGVFRAVYDELANASHITCE